MVNPKLLRFMKTVVTTLNEPLQEIGFNFENIDEFGNGAASFKSKIGEYIVVEIRNMWQDEVYHLDYEPGVILSYKYKDSSLVQVPFVNKPVISLFRNSTKKQIIKSTIETFKNFKINFFENYYLKRIILEIIILTFIQQYGCLNKSIFDEIKRKFNKGDMDSIGWSNTFIVLFKQLLEVGRSISVFDPDLNLEVSLNTISAFDSYLNVYFNR